MDRTTLRVIATALALTGCAALSFATPEFDVSVSLSDSARTRLSTLGENIKILAFFDGDSIDGPNPENAPFRAIILGSAETTVEIDHVAHVGSVAFSRHQHDLLTQGQYHLILNVVSGRRVDSHNLLDCSFVDLVVEPPNALQSPIHVDCGLIGERKHGQPPRNAAAG